MQKYTYCIQLCTVNKNAVPIWLHLLVVQLQNVEYMYMYISLRTDGFETSLAKTPCKFGFVIKCTLYFSPGVSQFMIKQAKTVETSSVH